MLAFLAPTADKKPISQTGKSYLGRNLFDNRKLHYSTDCVTFFVGRTLCQDERPNVAWLERSDLGLTRIADYVELTKMEFDRY